MLIVDAHLDLGYNALRGREVLRPAAEQTGDEEAASRDESIVVAVGRSGNSLGVELLAEAMELSDAELANRIIKLNTLAHLRSQLALREEWEAARVSVSSALATAEQVASYEALIDF